MPSIRIHRPGMFTTVQDLGRPGWSASGVPTGGAADTRSLRIGNRLLGNLDGATALEMTMTGATVEFPEPAIVAITGGLCRCTSRAGGVEQEHPMHAPIRLAAGSVLSIGPIITGVRAYLCIGGGIEVARVMDSASTHVAAAFGGLQGRALRAGDQPTVGVATGELPARQRIPSDWPIGQTDSAILRAVPVEGDDVTLAPLREWLFGAEHTVSAQSDRAGTRLRSPSGVALVGTGRMTSEGMPIGAVQMPPGGEPIILGPDHPTTGGYPVLAVVATVDLPLAGQLRPGQRVRFQRATQAEALHALAHFERELDRVWPPA